MILLPGLRLRRTELTDTMSSYLNLLHSTVSVQKVLHSRKKVTPLDSSSSVTGLSLRQRVRGRVDPHRYTGQRRSLYIHHQFFDHVEEVPEEDGWLTRLLSSQWSTFLGLRDLVVHLRPVCVCGCG